MDYYRIFYIGGNTMKTDRKSIRKRQLTRQAMECIVFKQALKGGNIPPLDRCGCKGRKCALWKYCPIPMKANSYVKK